jgi:hypothetical protein
LITIGDRVRVRGRSGDTGPDHSGKAGTCLGQYHDENTMLVKLDSEADALWFYAHLVEPLEDADHGDWEPTID